MTASTPTLLCRRDAEGRIVALAEVVAEGLRDQGMAVDLARAKHDPSERTLQDIPGFANPDAAA